MLFHKAFLLLAILSFPSFIEGYIYARLQHDLFQGYPKVIPVLDVLKPLNVTLGVTVLSVLDMDENTNEGTLQAWVSLQWDANLAWAPDMYDNITSISVSPHLLWTPDVTVFNNVGKLENEAPDLAVITSDGHAIWVPKWSMRTLCHKSEVNTTCSFKLGSWVHNGFQIDLRTNRDAVDLSSYSRHSKYSVLDATYTRHVETYPCCPETYTYINVELCVTFADQAQINNNGGLLTLARSFFRN